ncbi:MAG: TonB family protein [Pseudomonadota bacterium]
MRDLARSIAALLLVAACSPDAEVARDCSGASPLGKADYARLVNETFAANVGYPREAMEQRLEGKGMLMVAVEADGEISSLTLSERTGHQLLDAAILSMPLGMGALPPPPCAFETVPVEFAVPIMFRLSGPVIF